jgi:hypothetical protein
MTTTVTVYGSRAEDFRAVFGTATVPVTSPWPVPAELPGMDSPQPVYLIDLGWVSKQGHRAALVRHLARKFGLTVASVDADLDQVGMPILAHDCVVTSDSRDFL